MPPINAEEDAIVMKKVILLLGGILFSSFSQTPQSEVLVVVDGLRNREGKIVAALFDRPENFPHEAVRGKVIGIGERGITFIFDDVKPGRYALAVIHDENDNGKLDTNAIGIPIEGFAFGNNAMGFFGPPSFKKASIAMEESRVIQRLRIRYF